MKKCYKVLTRVWNNVLMRNIWFRFWTWESVYNLVSTATSKNKKLYILSFLHQSFDPFFFGSNCFCLTSINKEDFLLKLFNHETIVPFQPFLLKLSLINHKLNEKAKLALRIRVNPGNWHKDQRHVIAKKIPVVSCCTDARPEIRYAVQIHVFLFTFCRNCEIERAVFNFFLFFCRSVVDRILD